MEAFMTLEMLRSFSGQVAAVLLVTQLCKSAVPALATYWLRFVAVGTGILVHGMMAWSAGWTPPMYLLGVMNGVVVAMAAMKAAELIKGKPDPA